MYIYFSNCLLYSFWKLLFTVFENFYSNVVAGSEGKREGGPWTESRAGDDPRRNEEDAGDAGQEGAVGSQEEEHAAEKVCIVY